MSELENRLGNIDGSDRIAVIINRLSNEKFRLVTPLSFLNGTIGNPNTNKISNSFSGHPLSQLAPVFGQSLALSISRFWDGNSPRPMEALDWLVENSDGIERERKAWHPDWPHEALEIGTLRGAVNATRIRAKQFIDSELFKHIRVFRTEYLAHDEFGTSRDRKKYQLGAVPVSPSLKEAVEAANATVVLSDAIVSHFFFQIENSEDLIELHAKYTRMMWDALPNFSEREKLSFLD